MFSRIYTKIFAKGCSSTRKKIQMDKITAKTTDSNTATRTERTEIDEQRSGSVCKNSRVLKDVSKGCAYKCGGVDEMVSFLHTNDSIIIWIAVKRCSHWHKLTQYRFQIISLSLTTQETIISFPISFIMLILPFSFPYLINQYDENISIIKVGKSPNYCNRILFVKISIDISCMVLKPFLTFCPKNQDNRIFGTKSSSGWVLTHVRTFRITFQTFSNLIIWS